ncbi:hypothetical protein M9H77_15889 [Catharanthus roseus]|uniref:Uncharacterized protein n=1 Tax=Catharanthus roseus TaxID=4058 RepID=A0ACC0AZJ3_CATRO|nr:hypothetical protein M9H77_15889 [Catharanthus roseus]
MGINSDSIIIFSDQKKDLQLPIPIMPMEEKNDIVFRPPLQLIQDSCGIIAPASSSDEKEERGRRRRDQLQGQELPDATSAINDDGYETPTSEDHKIRVLVCPPPPRKPKSIPVYYKKGSSSRKRRAFVDLSNEVESLFPPALLVADFRKKIKKVRNI